MDNSHNVRPKRKKTHFIYISKDKERTITSSPDILKQTYFG